MTQDPYVYRCAPEIAILDILDAALDVASQAMNAANPGIETEAPYWIEEALGPAYQVDDRIADLQGAIGQYRRVVIKHLPPDPNQEEQDSALETGEEQLELPY